MERSLRQIDPSVHLTSAATLEVMGEIVSQKQIKKVLEPSGKSELRVRKQTMVMGVLVCIAMNLFTEEAIEDVLVKRMQGPRFLRPAEDIVTASKGAICQRRHQLGVAPMVSLFHQVCQPLATPDTPGAYLFDLGLVAIDGTQENLADTPANVRYFGRPASGRGAGAFPQVWGVYLCEGGTQAIFDAGFWPGILVMWACGFHSFDMCPLWLEKQGAQFLSRLPAKIKPLFPKRLSDGSYLAYIRPSDKSRRNHERLFLRVIEYKLDDPGRPGQGERRRLITSLLNEVAYPAQALVCAYHERWEVEITIDEMDTHQRQPKKPLRSRTPWGVLQAMYGLLIAHYCIRKIMHDAAVQAGLDPDRLSFTKALRRMRRAVFEFQIISQVQNSLLYARLLQDISRTKLPERDNRSNPRVVRRKMSNFDKKRDKQRAWPQPTKTFSEAVICLSKQYCV